MNTSSLHHFRRARAAISFPISRTITHAITHALLATLGLSAACAAQATVITFDGLTGLAEPLPPAYTEGDFTVTPTGGNWLQAQTFGAPVPSVYVADFHSAPFGSLSVTGPGLFTFDALDLAPGLSAAGYEVRGYKGGLQQFSLSGNELNTGAFHTLLSPSRLAIDTLSIDVSGAGPGSINVDNIQVSAVPEPQAWSLALVGLAMAGLAARRHGHLNGRHKG